MALRDKTSCHLTFYNISGIKGDRLPYNTTNTKTSLVTGCY